MTTTQNWTGSTHIEAILGKARSTRAALSRSGAALGAAALVALALAAPASARQDPGETRKQQYRTNIEMPYDARPSDNSPAYEVRKPAPLTQVVTIDDNAFEYLQVGLGALGGLALAGAAAGAVTVRQRHQHAM